MSAPPRTLFVHFPAWKAAAMLPRLTRLRAIRRAYRRACRQRYRLRMAEFDRATYLPAPTKARIRRRVATCVRRVVAHEAREEVWDEFVPLVRVAATYCGLAFAVGVAVLLGVLGAGGVAGAWAITVLLALLVFLLAHGAVVLTQQWPPIPRRWPVGAWPVGLLAAFAVALYWVYAMDLAGLPRPVRDGLGAGLAGMVLFLASYLGASWWGWLVCVVLPRRRKLRRYPEAELVESLRWVFVLVADPKASWGRLDYQRRIEWGLEWVARRLEQGRPRSLDRETDGWVCSGARQMAADIRWLKRFALLPCAGDRRRLARALAACLVRAVEGRWGQFAPTERTERTAAPSRRDQIAQLLAGMRPVLAAIAPLLVGGLVCLSPLPGQVKWPIAQLALGFGAVTVLSWLNPDYDKKIGSVNSLLGDLRPKKGPG